MWLQWVVKDIELWFLLSIISVNRNGFGWHVLQKNGTIFGIKLLIYWKESFLMWDIQDELDHIDQIFGRQEVVIQHLCIIFLSYIKLLVYANKAQIVEDLKINIATFVELKQIYSIRSCGEYSNDALFKTKNHGKTTYKLFVLYHNSSGN